jgi:hypothetical protein
LKVHFHEQLDEKNKSSQISSMLFNKVKSNQHVVILS